MCPALSIADLWRHKRQSEDMHVESSPYGRDLVVTGAGGVVHDWEPHQALGTPSSAGQLDAPSVALRESPCHHLVPLPRERGSATPCAGPTFHNLTPSCALLLPPSGTPATRGTISSNRPRGRTARPLPSLHPRQQQIKHHALEARGHLFAPQHLPHLVLVRLARLHHGVVQR